MWLQQGTTVDSISRLETLLVTSLVIATMKPEGEDAYAAAGSQPIMSFKFKDRHEI